MRGYIALVVVALLALMGWRLHHMGYESGQAEVQARWDAERAVNTKAALDAVAKNRATEDKRNTKQAEVTNDIETKRRAPARAAAVAAAAVGGGLRHAAEPVAALGRAAAEDPTATGECKAAGGAVSVLAELLIIGAERRIELARYADEVVAPAAECIGRYDALMPEVSPRKDGNGQDLH